MHQKESKCDQLRKGVHVYLGKTGGPLCSVAAGMECMKRREGSPRAIFP